jgi:lysophosphatidate acyltransferase
MHAVLLYPIYASVAYVVTMLALFAFYHSQSNPPLLVGFLARCMAGYLSLIACAAYGTAASLILRCLNLHYKYGQWTTARAFKWVCRYSLGVKFDILDDGEKKLNAKRPYVIVLNHQTELDILLLGWIWPKHCSVTAKKSLRNVPFLGWFMTLSGAVFIDRADRNQAVKAFEGAAKTMKDLGQSVLIFPEGTRSYSVEPMLLPFKKGAFHLAVQAGVDILPVVAENYSQILNLKAKRFNAGTIRVKGKSSTYATNVSILTSSSPRPDINQRR